MKDRTFFDPKYKTLIGYLKGYEVETLEDILNAVSRYTGLSIKAIKREVRYRKIVEARYIYCMEARQYKKYYSLNQIGELIGYKHDEVIRAIKETQNIPTLYKKYLDFHDQLKANGIMEVIINPRASKKVKMIQYGKKIKEFESIKKAAFITEIDRRGIRLCLKGERTYAGGYQWEYA